MSLNVDPNTLLTQHSQQRLAAISRNEHSDAWMESSSSSSGDESPDPLLILLSFRIFNEVSTSRIPEEDTISKRLKSTIIIRSFPTPTLRELRIEIRKMIKTQKGFNMEKRLQEGDLQHAIPLSRMKLSVRWESTRGSLPDLDIETDDDLTEALEMIKMRDWRDVICTRVDMVRRLPVVAGKAEEVEKGKADSAEIADEAKEEGGGDEEIVLDEDDDEETSDEEEEKEGNAESCKQQSGQPGTPGDGKTEKVKKMKLPEANNDKKDDGSFEHPNFEGDFMKLTAKPKRKRTSKNAGSKDVEVISLSSDDGPKKKKMDKKDKSGSRSTTEGHVSGM